MHRYTWVAVFAMLAAMTGGMALRLGETGHAAWLVSRASGLAAFGLLSGSVVFGLLISTKVTEGASTRLAVFAGHQFLSVLSLAFIAVHGGALLFDGFFHFTALDLVVPFAAPYAPVFTGFGVISAWVAAAVTGSFWARSWVGQKAWRRLHYASFAAYLLSFFHGVAAGTDTGRLPVAFLYSLSLTLVGMLLAYRLVRVARPRPNEARRPLAA